MAEECTRHVLILFPSLLPSPKHGGRVSIIQTEKQRSSARSRRLHCCQVGQRKKRKTAGGPRALHRGRSNCALFFTHNAPTCQTAVFNKLWSQTLVLIADQTGAYRRQMRRLYIAGKGCTGRLRVLLTGFIVKRSLAKKHHCGKSKLSLKWFNPFWVDCSDFLKRYSANRNVYLTV